MRRFVIVAIVGAVLGLVVGYLLFARIGNVRLSLDALISFGRGGTARSVLRRTAETITGIDRIRRNILISGGIGAAICVGAVLFGGRGRAGRRSRRR